LNAATNTGGSWCETLRRFLVHERLGGTAEAMEEERPTIYELARAIKRDDVGLWHCLQSIGGDARFVQEVPNAHSLTLSARPTST
jgi:hypothetical protein